MNPKILSELLTDISDEFIVSGPIQLFLPVTDQADPLCIPEAEQRPEPRMIPAILRICAGLAAAAAAFAGLFAGVRWAQRQQLINYANSALSDLNSAYEAGTGSSDTTRTAEQTTQQSEQTLQTNASTTGTTVTDAPAVTAEPGTTVSDAPAATAQTGTQSTTAAHGTTAGRTQQESTQSTQETQTTAQTDHAVSADTVPDDMLNVYKYAESKGLHLIDTAGYYRNEIVNVPDHAKFEGDVPGYTDGFLEQFNAGESINLLYTCTASSRIRLNLKPSAVDFAPLDELFSTFAAENSAITYGHVNGVSFAMITDYGLHKDTADRVCALLAENPAAEACVESIEYTPVFLHATNAYSGTGEIAFMFSYAQAAEAQKKLTVPVPWHLSQNRFSADRAVTAEELEALFAAVEQAYPGTVLKPSMLAGVGTVLADSEIIWRAPGS